MNLVRALIQKPVVGGKVTIPAAGTRKLPLATIPLCKYSGTKEEETWSNPFGGFKKKKCPVTMKGTALSSVRGNSIVGV